MCSEEGSGPAEVSEDCPRYKPEAVLQTLTHTPVPSQPFCATTIRRQAWILQTELGTWFERIHTAPPSVPPFPASTCPVPINCNITLGVLLFYKWHLGLITPTALQTKGPIIQTPRKSDCSGPPHSTYPWASVCTPHLNFMRSYTFI